MCKYNIGDCVRIKENFWDIEPTMPLGISRDMHTMVGEEYEIKCLAAHRPTQYKFGLYSGKDWVWDANWLEPVNTFTVEANELDEILKGT